MLSDDEIRDIFRWQVLQNKEKFEVGSFDDWLEQEDKDLLEEYAPKLFNTYKNIEKLENIMIEWAILLFNYRHEHIGKNIIHGMGGKQKIPTYAKKSKDEKITILKSRVEDILKLLSTNFSTKEHIIEFTDILKKVHATPDDYFTYKPKIPIKKQPIKDYLIGLELKGKTKEINDFIKSI